MARPQITTAVVEPSRKGWLCWCGAYYYQSQSAIEAVRDAHDHNRIVHQGQGDVVYEATQEDNNGR